MTTTRYGASRAEVATLLDSWDLPAYRTAQLYDGLWTKRKPIEDLGCGIQSTGGAVGV